ncbi:MAG: hypothetical protein AAGD35_23600 [Actinomycetota bacterium]
MEMVLYAMYGVIGVMIVIPFILQAQVIRDLYRKWRAGELSWPSSWGGGPVGGADANTGGRSASTDGDPVTLAKAEAAQARAAAAEARAAAAEARAEAAEAAAAAAAADDGDTQSSP